EAALTVPREEDRHLPREVLARRRDAEPLGLVGAGHVRLLAAALRADHDARQVEADVREAAEQSAADPRGALRAFPALPRRHQLVAAVGGERREQAGQVTLVLGDRVPLPELPDRVVLLGRRVEPDQVADVGGHAADSTQTARRYGCSTPSTPGWRSSTAR